ncbi:cell division protein FtsQ/DivIB [Aureibacillus halotolerans]|uniref:Cell division protein DivIB n=1 Tax=Aureibacillus halotolerans TaxID=1508390 RepID=A0A4R6U735_9BACI|nr:FtsQ-type POTRA domain-containing protein [Aureibacillus halotolerans]TDQ42328.1 cell division protein FtsQ [Aureibacillus halotolerans]
MENEKKVYNIEDRIPNLKKHRKRKANRMLILYVSVFFLLISAILYFQSPFSHVQSIYVFGEHYVSEENIVQLSGLSDDVSFVQVDPDTVATQIEAHKEIDTVSVTKEFPNTVRIEVTEHQRLAYLKKDGLFHPLLDNGTMLDALPEETVPSAAPLLVDWTDDEALKIIAAELENVPGIVLNAISTVTYAPTDDEPMRVIVYMNDGHEVHTVTKGFAQKMADYPSIIAQLETDQKGIIYLDVASYFKPYDQEETSELPNEGDSSDAE